MANGKIKLEVSDEGDVAYVSLKDHPGNSVPGVIVKQIALRDLLMNYDGPDISLDFDGQNTLLGIEIDISEHDK